MTKIKTVKVRITNEVHGYRYKGRRYLPGEVVEIPENFRRADFMDLVVDEPKPELEPIIVASDEPTVITSDEVTVSIDEPTPEPPQEETVKPKKRRRRKTT